MAHSFKIGKVNQLLITCVMLKASTVNEIVT